MAATATERNIDLVRRFNDDVFNGRDYDRASDFQATDYVQHGPLTGMTIRGTAESIESMRTFHEAFSDLRSTVEFAFGDGEYVCAYYTYRGTHDGELMGIPPTDAEAEVPGVIVNRFEDGKVAEAWVLVDLLGLLQQVGVVDPMDQPAD